MPDQKHLRGRRFAPFTKKKSVVLLIASLVGNILTLMSLITYIDQAVRKILKIPKGEDTPLWLPEVWVIAMLLAQISVLIWWTRGHWLMWAIPVYGLVDILAATSRDIVAGLQVYSDEDGGYILIRDRLRWLLMAALNVAQVVLCFGILLLNYGDSFKPPIDRSLPALYQSVLTLTTLGYGDIKPVDQHGQVIVCLELAFFLVILVAKIPIAVSVVRVKEFQRDRGSVLNPSQNRSEGNKSMNLKEFISEALGQIIGGIAEAQKTASSYAAEVNPHLTGEAKDRIELGFLRGESGRIASFVDFDIALTVSEKSGMAGGIGIFAAGVGLGSKGESKSEDTSVSRVRFRVPILFPSMPQDASRSR